MGMWLTTAPNPSARSTGFDAGQRGWRLHYVREATPEGSFKDVRFRSALCGLQPAHGWGLDLFIEDRCTRCSAALAKVEAA